MDPNEVYKNLKTIGKLRRELIKETDRGSCLMAVSYIDYQLQQLLFKKLVGSNNHKNPLFTPNGPLGTLSSRINLSYSIGLLSKTAVTDLNIIRKIRNSFGHSYESMDFQTELVKKEILKLKSSIYNSEEMKNLEPRTIFLNSVSGIMGEINNTLIFNSSFKEKINTVIDNDSFKGIIKQGKEAISSAMDKSEDGSFPKESISKITDDMIDQIFDIEK